MKDQQATEERHRSHVVDSLLLLLQVLPCLSPLFLSLYISLLLLLLPNHLFPTSFSSSPLLYTTHTHPPPPLPPPPYTAPAAPPPNNHLAFPIHAATHLTPSSTTLPPSLPPFPPITFHTTAPTTTKPTPFRILVVLFAFSHTCE